MKTIDVKGKPYVEVNERIKYFRTNFKDWSLESDLISLDNGVCVMKATVRNPEGVIKATGYAYEKEGSTFINKTSYIENCETSAWGRALGNLGIGVDTSIASAEEVLNASLNQETPQKNDDFVPDVIKKQEAKGTISLEDAITELQKYTDTTNAFKYFNNTVDKVNDKTAFRKEYQKYYNKLKGEK